MSYFDRTPCARCSGSPTESFLRRSFDASLLLLLDRKGTAGLRGWRVVNPGLFVAFSCRSCSVDSAARVTLRSSSVQRWVCQGNTHTHHTHTQVFTGVLGWTFYWHASSVYNLYKLCHLLMFCEVFVFPLGTIKFTIIKLSLVIVSHFCLTLHLPLIHAEPTQDVRNGILQHLWSLWSQ